MKKDYFRVASEVLTGPPRIKFRQDCKKMRSDPKNFTRYVVGYFLPWLRNEEYDNRLINGEKTLIDAEGDEWEYQGQIDIDSKKATGIGVATNECYGTYSGTFLNDLFEGIGKSQLR